jgi:DNA-binding transcriptional ArsR family regulator
VPLRLDVTVGRVIQMRLSVADIERMRFAYSPLAEVAESLWMISSGRIPPVHREWLAMVRERLARANASLLGAVVPAHPAIAEMFSVGVTDVATSIDRQLQHVAEYPVDRLRAEVAHVWEGWDMPRPAVELLAMGLDGPRRLADALHTYWSLALEPYWPQIRAILDDDVAYRATRLTGGGIEALLVDLHPEVTMSGWSLQIAKLHHHHELQLNGQGLLLIPSVFAWPNVVVELETVPSLIYGSRGVGNLWGTAGEEERENHALGELFGRSRAAILIALAVPRSTTDLARRLGHTPPSVSQHLAVLRRTALVTSWRSGRRVLYQRTPLASSIVAASGAELADESVLGELS